MAFALVFETSWPWAVAVVREASPEETVVALPVAAAFVTVCDELLDHVMVPSFSSPSLSIRYLPPQASDICLYASFRRASRTPETPSFKYFTRPGRAISFTGAFSTSADPGLLTIVAVHAVARSMAIAAAARRIVNPRMMVLAARLLAAMRMRIGAVVTVAMTIRPTSTAR
jgi:hypothetical protein